MSVEHFRQVDSEPETKTQTKSETTKPKPKESPLLTELRQYQNKTVELFTKEGLQLPHEIAGQKMYVDDFVRKVNEEKGPIQKIITTMKRIPKVVRDEKTGQARKIDVLEVHSELRGVDWKNNPLRVTDYYDGFYYRPEFRTVTKGRDDDTGDLILEKQHMGINKIHTIELTDKNRRQIVDDFINRATGTYRDEILFYYQVPSSVRGAGHRDGSAPTLIPVEAINRMMTFILKSETFKIREISSWVYALSLALFVNSPLNILIFFLFKITSFIA